MSNSDLSLYTIEYFLFLSWKKQLHPSDGWWFHPQEESYTFPLLPHVCSVWVTAVKSVNVVIWATNSVVVYLRINWCSSYYILFPLWGWFDNIFLNSNTLNIPQVDKMYLNLPLKMLSFSHLNFYRYMFE